MNFPQMMQFINTFKNSNPNEQINRMLSSGQINQSMLQQAKQMAKPIYEVMRQFRR